MADPSDNTVIQKYFMIDGDGFAIIRSKDELWAGGIDVSRLPTSRFAIIDTGEFLPIRDLANCAVFARETDLKKHIPVWSKD